MSSGIFGGGSTLGALGEAVDLPEVVVTGSPEGTPCKSPDVISYVQSVIGASVDGKWGPESQKKLNEYGKKFADVAGGCTGSPPVYNFSGGTTTTVTKTPPATLPPAKKSGISSMVSLSSPTTWIIVAAVAAAGVIVFTKPKKKF